MTYIEEMIFVIGAAGLTALVFGIALAFMKLVGMALRKGEEE